MPTKITTGNSIVDTVGMMHFTGNVIPDIWYEYIRTKDGKPYLLAIIILSEIVYWYRPAIIRDENTDNITYKKKFSADDFLQKSYAQLCKKFNVSEKQVRSALEALEALNIIKRHFRTIDTPNGRFSNVMFLELIPQGLIQITFPDEPTETSEKKAIAPEVNTYCPAGKLPLPSGETATTPQGNTYTKNNTEISTEIITATAEAGKLLDAFSLDDKDIRKIVKVACGNTEKIKAAVECLKSSHSKIDNVVGFLISAINNNYKATSYSPRHPNGFNNFTGREYSDEDYKAIERALLAT